jgi:hypothetical protein
MGDSGGGFMMRRGRKWYLRGLISFGYTYKALVDKKTKFVCDEMMPSLFLDLANQLEWIKQNYISQNHTGD